MGVFSLIFVRVCLFLFRVVVFRWKVVCGRRFIDRLVDRWYFRGMEGGLGIVVLGFGMVG